MFKSLVVCATLVTTSAISIAPVSAQVGRLDLGLRSTAPVATPVQYWRRGYGGGYYRGRRGFPVGAGIAAGIAAGALLGGAIGAAGNPGYPAGDPVYAEAPEAAQPEDADAYCASRFRSYDPASGTYMGYDGARHSCP